MVRFLHNQTACSDQCSHFYFFIKTMMYSACLFSEYLSFTTIRRESARVGVRKRTKGGDQVIAPPGGQERLTCCQRNITVPRHEPRYKSKQLQTKHFSHTLFSKEQPCSLWFSHSTTITSPFHSYKRQWKRADGEHKGSENKRRERSIILFRWKWTGRGLNWAFRSVPKHLFSNRSTKKRH